MSEMPLTVVSDPTPIENDIPKFEGQSVAATKATITSVSALEVGDRVFRLDQSVKLLVEATVASVQHKVNDKSGFLERIHTLKAIDTAVVDWDVDMDAVRDVLPPSP